MDRCIFKNEVITYLWIWILDSFGIISTCLSKYFTGSKSNYSKQIYLCYAIYNPQLLYSPRKCIYFTKSEIDHFLHRIQSEDLQRTIEHKSSEELSKLSTLLQLYDIVIQRYHHHLMQTALQYHKNPNEWVFVVVIKPGTKSNFGIHHFLPFCRFVFGFPISS